jgi:hypothetical protein
MKGTSMNSKLKQLLIIAATVSVTLLCNYFLFQSTAAYSQQSSPYKEEEYGKIPIPKNWGRLVEFNQEKEYMVFEANDGTIRHLDNYVRLYDPENAVLVHVFKRK